MNKCIKIPVLIMIMLILSIGMIYSQTEQYKFRHLTTEDGLPANYTWSIMQDSKGFMWFTTRAGLCRYDGYNVRVFQYDPADSTSISELYVKSTITEDTNGFIWVGSTNGLNKFDPITETFTRYYKNPDDPHSIRGNWNRITYLDRQGVVWIGADNQGLNRYNAETDNFDSFLPSPDFSLSSGIRGIYEDSSGILWVGTGSGLYQFNRETGEFTLIKQLKDIGERIANRFTTITEDIDGNIWYCADRIYKYNKSTKKLNLFTGFSVESTGSSNPTYMNILLEKHDNKQTLWIARNGLYKYDLSEGKLITIINDPSDQESFVGLNPRALFRDSSGLLWIATVSGITILDLRSGEIKTHPDFAEKYQIDATSFLKDRRGQFWFGGDNGLVHFDEKMKLVHWYSSMKNNENETSFKGAVTKIFEDSDNNIWIVSYRDGIYLLDREKNEFLRCKLLRYGKDVSPDNLNDIYEDTQGIIWVGSDGLFKRMKGSPQPTTFNLDTSNRSTKYYTHTRIQEDHFGNLWVCAVSGVLLRQPASYRGTDTFFEYKHNPNDSNSLSNSHVWSVYVDDFGDVWAGTNQGLNRYVKEKDCFERFLMETGSGTSFIYDLVRDKNGYVWLIAASGLIGFNPSGYGTFPNKIENVKQYLSFEDIYTDKIYKDNKGIIYVGSFPGTGNGYFTFYPDDITENKFIPPVVITSFSIRNKPVELDSSIATKQHLTLSWDQNFFSFEFAALDYTNSTQNQYAYILEGLDEDWVYSGNRRNANYTGVPPGNYSFKVKGSNSDGYWNEEGTSISITILPPPWKTWWAYAFYLLFIISILTIIIRFYLRRQRLLHKLELEQIQTEKLEELDKLKSRFFANISHEFRTPLTLILGPIEKMRSYIKDNEPQADLDMMQRNARRLQRLINQLLNLSRIESGKMKLQAREENIVSLVNGYVQSFESLAKQKKIDLIFNSSEENIQLFVDKDKIEKILYNLLSNAFKFTEEGGRIEISITPLNPPSRGDLLLADPLTKRSAQSPPFRGDGRGVQIKISDTGQGIPPDKLDHIFERFYQTDDSYYKDQEGTGIGLALTKELVKLHHGNIAVESEAGKGTTFSVFLPIGKEHLKPDEIIDETETTVRKEESPELIPEVEISDSDLITADHQNQSIIDEKEDKPHLLIVDDNTDLRTYMRGYLEKDYYISEARDGVEGFGKAIEKIPDLIISDVMMPKMDGYELCKKLKTDERTCHIPLILLTARASKESRLEGLEKGADDFITKPFDGEELLVRVKNLIDQRKRLSEHYRKDYEIIQESIKEPVFTMDEKFLQKAKGLVEKNLSNPEYGLDKFASDMALSRFQLHRKLRALFNQSITEFIRTIRLNYAIGLLKKRVGTISEIAYDAGFNNPSYFSTSFRKQYGISPTEYLMQLDQTDNN